MSSTHTPLGVELMATGENAGTWGTKTNTNLQIIEQISGGYKVQTLNTAGAGANTTALTQSDGATGSTVATRVIIFGAVSPETIGGNKIVTFPVLTENFYLINNGTSGSYTVQLKAASGSGATVTWATDDKGWKLVYFDGVASNTGVYDTGFSTTTGDVTLTGTQTLTNKTLTSPKIGTSILDTNGLELMKITATGSAENEFTMAAGASGAGPTLSSTGSSDTNIDINVVPAGTGNVNLSADAVQVGDNNANATITTQGTGDLILNTNNGSSSGNITLLDGANGNIKLSPNGTGEILVGAGDATGDITSNGAYDLIIDTNEGTNAGNITLANGANGEITVTPNGTGVVAIEGSMNPSVSSTGKALIMGF